MRTDGILLELNKRITDHVRIADEAYRKTQYNIHMAVADSLRGVIVLIESYEMSGMEDETETTQVS